MSTQGCINQAEMVKYQRENAEEPRTGPGTMDHGGVNHIDNANRNRRIILNIIRENAPATRRQLASMSGLSLSTTKRVVESLQAESLIKEAKLTPETWPKSPCDPTESRFRLFRRSRDPSGDHGALRGGSGRRGGV